MLHICIGRLLLFILGFYDLESKYIPSKRGNKTPTSSPGENILGGDIIITNHNSYIDLIYLLYKFARLFFSLIVFTSFRYSPIFTSLPNTWEGEEIPKGYVIQRTFWGALSDVVYNTKYQKDQCVPLEKVLEASRKGHSGPVVIFPEATTTNGKVLLGVVPALTPDVIHKSKEVHVIAFRSAWFLPPHRTQLI